MHPLIFVGGAAAAAWHAKPRCASCASKLTLNKACLVCGRLVCGDCGVDFREVVLAGWHVAAEGRVCKGCKGAHTEHIMRTGAAAHFSAHVSTYPRTYRGRTPSPKLGKHIESDEHETRELAQRHLQILAWLQQCASVTHIEFEAVPHQDGNYRYRRWKARGLI